MVFTRAFLRAAAAARSTFLRRRVRTTVSRDPPSPRPPFRPRDGTNYVYVAREEDAARVSNLVAANLRHGPRIRPNAGLDLISESLPRDLQQLPVQIQPNLIPVLEKLIKKHVDAAAVMLRDSIVEEFKKQNGSTNAFTYVAVRVSLLARALSMTCSAMILGIPAFYLFYPEQFRANLDAYIKQLGNSFMYVISHGWFGETLVQYHERVLKERRAAEEKKRLEQEGSAPPSTRGRESHSAGNSNRWNHEDKGMSSVGKMEWLKSQR